MPKNIVFCADGTWNHPNSPAVVSDADTNVYKLYKSLAVSATQVTFYDDGVGSDGQPIEKLLGGACGAGLFQKIKDGYTSIAHVYEEGDNIFIFGFSRGAYTARSLAGMIANCGLPTQNFTQSLVDTAFQAYRSKDQLQALLASLAGNNMYNAIITCLGVWDTVGALGIPGMLFSDADRLIYGFLDTGLHPDVQAAFHALSIDERRAEFQPTLWTSAPVPGQTMDQVWFAGVHSDVGGGYAEEALSDITLSWMLKKAIGCGIEALPSSISTYETINPKNALGQIHESWNVLWAIPKLRTIASDSTLSNSVSLRLAGGVGYQPKNITLTSSGQLSDYSSEAVV